MAKYSGNNMSFNAGRDFFSKERAKKLRGTQAEAVLDTPLGENIELASQLADQQEISDELIFDETLQTPVDELQQGMATPAVSGPAIGRETFVSPDISDIKRANLSAFTDVELTPELEERARGASLPTYRQPGMNPGATDVLGTDTPEGNIAALKSDLEAQAASPRAIISSEQNTEDFTKAVDVEVENAQTDFLQRDTKETNPAEGYKSLTSLVNLGRRSMDNLDPENAIFNTVIDWQNAEGFEQRLETDPQRLLFENADAFNGAIKRYDRLNMLIDPKNPNSQIRPEFGAAAMLAYIMLVSEASLLQDKETDADVRDRAYANAMGRATIGPKLSKMIERLLYPTQMDDPKEIFKGVSEGYGYKTRLTADEHNLVGQYLMQGFTDAKWNNMVTSQTITDANGKKKTVYNTTRQGQRRLYAIRKGIRNQLGLGNFKAKPLASFPTDDGRFLGESATVQKPVTGGLDKNYKPSEVTARGIYAMANTAYTVPETNALLFSGMMAASLIQPQGQRKGVFSEVLKISQKYYRDKASELYKGYIAQYKAGKLKPQDLGTYIDPRNGNPVSYGDGGALPKFDASGNPIIDPDTGQIVYEFPPQDELERVQRGFTQAAMDNAKSIQDSHIANNKEILDDGINRVNQRFYYAQGTIGNSGRMLIANDELNPHQDKSARFIVGGYKPVIVKKTVGKEKGVDPLINQTISKLKKNGTRIPGEKGFKKYSTEENFIAIMARTLVPGAGTSTLSDPIEQLKALKELLKPDAEGRRTILLYGKELFDYTAAQEGYVARAKQRLLTGQQTPQEDMPRPLAISDSLNDFLSEHEKNDTFYYALESLHELYRYATAAQGTSISTRAKGEVDGDSNGTVIQGMQMGVMEILERGGVLYNPSKLNVLMEERGDKELTQKQIDELRLATNETNIRQFVVETMHNISQSDKDDILSESFANIAQKPLQAKALMKYPVMTSVYGADPGGHIKYGAEFIKKFPEAFEGVIAEDLKGQTPLMEKLLATKIEEGLVGALGGALEHAAVMRRVGRAFNFAERIMEVEGANGQPIHAGGIRYSAAAPIARQEQGYGGTTNVVRFGSGVDRQQKSIDITMQQQTPTASLGAKGTPYDIGSGLRNQSAVMGTQNVDATISQLSMSDVHTFDPTAYKMQIFDGFIFGASNFLEGQAILNRNFNKVNLEYFMAEKEREAFNNMMSLMKKSINKAKENKVLFDIGTEGKWLALGEFFSEINTPEGPKDRGQQIINRDMPGVRDRKTGAILEGTEAEINQKEKAKAAHRELRNSIPDRNKVNSPSYKISAELFERLFFGSVKLLQIQNTLDGFVAKVSDGRKTVRETLEKQSKGYRGMRGNFK